MRCSNNSWPVPASSRARPLPQDHLGLRSLCSPCGSGRAREEAGTGKTKKGADDARRPPTSPLSQQSMFGNRRAPDRLIAMLIQLQHRHFITLGIEQLAILEVVAITQR